MKLVAMALGFKEGCKPLPGAMVLYFAGNTPGSSGTATGRALLRVRDTNPSPEACHSRHGLARKKTLSLIRRIFSFLREGNGYPRFIS